MSAIAGTLEERVDRAAPVSSLTANARSTMAIVTGAGQLAIAPLAWPVAARIVLGSAVVLWALVIGAGYGVSLLL